MGSCASKPKELKRKNSETLPVEQPAAPKVEETQETVAVAVVEAEATTSANDYEVKVESNDEAKVEEKSVEDDAPLVVEVSKPEEEVIVAADAVLPGILVLPGEDIVFENPKEETVEVVETDKEEEEEEKKKKEEESETSPAATS